MKRIGLYILCFCISGCQWVTAQSYYRVDRLGSSVNSSSANEMAPFIFKDGIVFSSNRKNNIVLVTTDQDGNYMYNLYHSTRRGNDNWTSAELFARDLNNRYNQSTACISQDGRTLIYTSTLGSDDVIGDHTGDTLKNGLFFARLENEKWVPAGGFSYNNTNYNLAHPFLSADGSQLFFASDMPGGYGGYDIYVSNKQGSRWTRPENLGPAINTEENEVFPFLFNNNRLYFSSSGHNSQGGMDIFYSDLINDTWSRPVKMPRPFNSRSDDFAYTATAELDTGYFVSNRRGTDDIYAFISTFPSFSECPGQIDEEFCYEFYESGSLDLDTTSLKYEWDLGDGTRVRDLRVDHCYDSAGYYLVQLNVIDTLTGDVYFSEAAYDLIIEKIEQPYMIAPDTAGVNDNITFDAAESEIRSFTIEEYYWDFGDGEVANEVRSRHRFDKPGEYIVRLGITGTGTEGSAQRQKACASKRIVIIDD